MVSCRPPASSAQAGITEQPGVVLADSGYWHDEQMDQLAARRHLGADPTRLQQTQRAPGRAGTVAATLDAPRCSPPRPARELYEKRHKMIEPVFGQIKFNRRIDRFQRRGRAAHAREWRLAAATHNLLKLHTAPDRHRRPLKRQARRDRSTTSSWTPTIGTHTQTGRRARFTRQPQPKAAVSLLANTGSQLDPTCGAVLQSSYRRQRDP